MPQDNWRATRERMENDRRIDLLRARSAGMNNFPSWRIDRMAYEWACESCRMALAQESR